MLFYKLKPGSDNAFIVNRNGNERNLNLNSNDNWNDNYLFLAVC